MIDKQESQFSRNDYQQNLYRIHHYRFDSCGCPAPHGKHWDCIFDCCKYELSETAKIRSTTEEERAKHEVAMGNPSANKHFTEADLLKYRKDAMNTYRPVITEADRKTVKVHKWWEFWK